MLLYEVNLEVHPDIYPSYCQWLSAHIAEVLTSPGFIEARLWQDQKILQDAWIPLSVHYYLESQSHLDRYLSEAAPQLRADGERRFPAQFRAQRRVLQLQEFIRLRA